MVYFLLDTSAGPHLESKNKPTAAGTRGEREGGDTMKKKATKKKAKKK